MDQIYNNNEKDGVTTDVETAKIISRLSNDFQYFAAAVLKVVDKEGNLKPFLLNHTQKLLLAKIQKLEKAKKPVRLIIVKARQLGCSTFIAAYYFWKIITAKHYSGLIVADEIQDAQSLLAKAHVFYDNLPEVLKPPKKYRSKKELYFENLNSSLQIDTASNSSLGRSRTFQLVHLSEIAYYPGEGKEALLSLRQTVADKPGTYVILESTANGLDNIFYEEVMRAERKESEYEVLFFPWYQEKEYALGAPGEGFELTTEELGIKEKYALDFAQLRWRRRAITDKCSDSVDLFKQEYPSNLEEAFRYTGHPVFDLVRLSEQARYALPAKLNANIDYVNQILVENKNGILNIWEFPDKDAVYVIGVDIAEGKENEDLKRDYSVIEVFNAITREQVAEYRSQESWDLVAIAAVFLGKYYNKAYMVIESNNHGLAVISKIRDLHYPYLYKERDYNETGRERQERIGFRSTNRSKPMLISNSAELFRDGYIKLNSRVLMDEMSKFSQDPQGHLKASLGHDDTVIAMSLAIWGLRYAPVMRKAKTEEEPIKWLPKMGEWELDTKSDGIESKWLRSMFKNYIPKGFSN